jgi:hypothetical protein
MMVVVVGVAVSDAGVVCVELAEPVTTTVRVCKAETEIVAMEEAVGESDAEVEVEMEGLAVGVAVPDDVPLSLTVCDGLPDGFGDCD